MRRRKEAFSPFDRSLMVLARRAAPTFLQLAQMEADPNEIRFEDVSINLPEHRADQVMLIGPERSRKRWGIQWEYQLHPDRRKMVDWQLKNAVLNKQLKRPIKLVVVYLTRGRYRTFPNVYSIEGGGRPNHHTFDAIRLWEHADQIRSGVLGPLAPLLVLCEDAPTTETLREERELILKLNAPTPLTADLFGVATMVGMKFFSQEVLKGAFREEMGMLKEASFVDEWIREGKAEAAAQAAETASRQMLRRVLVARFGRLPARVARRLERLSVAECESLVDRASTSDSLSALDL